jgi:myo-inositol-1(or 4)-monophosphatase
MACVGARIVDNPQRVYGVKMGIRMNIQWLCQLVRESAELELLPRFQQVASRRKEDGSLVTEADLAVQQRIKDSLLAEYPQIPLLGEEMSGEEHRRILHDSPTGFWCLDPLDGTSNYVAGMPCFATSLAYLLDGEVRIGIIYDPLRDECFHAIAGEGAWLNGQRLQLTSPVGRLDQCLAMVDFKRLTPKLASQLASDPPYRSQRSIGSVALDWCWLAAGRVELYLHGGAKLWDYTAGSLIHRQAGGALMLTAGHVSLPSEGPLGLQPRMAIAAANSSLLNEWHGWLRQYD